MTTPEDGDPGTLSVPLADWDELRNRASMVLEENQILTNQEAVLKNTIEELTDEFHWMTTTQSKEILLLMQDKNVLEEQLILTIQEKDKMGAAVQELLRAYSNLQSKHQEKVKEWNMTYKALLEKYRKILDESQKKVDMKNHQQELGKLEQTKATEIKLMANEMKQLNSKLKEVQIERGRLESKLAKSEGSGAKMKFLESELKETKMKLSQSLVKAEVACCQELVHRKTISQIIKVAETSVIDRDTLADIIRQEETRKGKLKEALNYVYHRNNLDPGAFTRENIGNIDGDILDFQYNDINGIDSNCEDDISGLDDSFGDHITNINTNNNHRDDNIIESDNDDKLVQIHYDSGDDNSLSAYYGDYGDKNIVENESKDENKMMEVRGKPPISNLNKFLKKEEEELNQMRQMVRLKQAYIEKLQK